MTFHVDHLPALPLRFMHYTALSIHLFHPIVNTFPPPPRVDFLRLPPQLFGLAGQGTR